VCEDYKGATPTHLRAIIRGLGIIAENESYTPRTRRLASGEIEYVKKFLHFRTLPIPVRRKLLKRGRAPWTGRYEYGDENIYGPNLTLRETER